MTECRLQKSRYHLSSPWCIEHQQFEDSCLKARLKALREELRQRDDVIRYLSGQLAAAWTELDDLMARNEPTMALGAPPAVDGQTETGSG